MLLCLVVCMTLLASFFLPFASLIKTCIVIIIILFLCLPMQISSVHMMKNMKNMTKMCFKEQPAEAWLELYSAVRVNEILTIYS